jgi:nitroreductase / dihydropteridine reductase
MNTNQILKKRYATKSFNGEKVDEKHIEKIKENIQLSASSFGLQPYRIIVINDEETKLQLLGASYNQPQITTASHIFVFCADTQISKRIDEYEQMLIAGQTPESAAKNYTNMMRGSVGNLTVEQATNWAAKQCYIALSNAMNTATELGLDSCPMEGFDSSAYHKILALPPNLIPTVVLPIGIANDTPKAKLRFAVDKLFIELDKDDN